MKKASFLKFNLNEKNKKREFQSSELVKSFARIHGFEDKLTAFEIKELPLKTIWTNLFSWKLKA